MLELRLDLIIYGEDSWGSKHKEKKKKKNAPIQKCSLLEMINRSLDLTYLLPLF